MPFCPQCGVDNPDAARYCDQCGAMLIPAPKAPVASIPPAMPVTPTVVSGPVTCAQCGASAIPGEAFCDNCGAPLSAPSRPVVAPPQPVAPSYSGVPPQPAYPPPQPVAPPPSYQAPVTPPPSYQPPVASPLPSYQPPMTPPYQAPTAARTSLSAGRLIVVASSAVIPLPAGTQVVVGRGDPVSNFFPDIDLTPHGALDMGVGRRHLRIFIQGGQVMCEDMDSTNGTQVGGQRVGPRQPRALHSGDRIVLGQLELQYSEV